MRRLRRQRRSGERTLAVATDPRRKRVSRYSAPELEKIESERATLACTDPEILERVGYIATYFPQLEETMSKVFAVLMGTEDEVAAGYIFRAIVAQQGRIKMMDRLLASPINADLDDFYDQALTEFEKLNKLRNQYLHGLWRTRDTGEVLLSVPTGEPLAAFRTGRKVSSKELDDVIERMGKLNIDVLMRTGVELAQRRKDARDLRKARRP